MVDNKRKRVKKQKETIKEAGARKAGFDPKSLGRTISTREGEGPTEEQNKQLQETGFREKTKGERRIFGDNRNASELIAEAEQLNKEQGVNVPTQLEENIQKDLGKQFVDTVTGLPIIGTPIRTVAGGIARATGSQEAVEELGPITSGDVIKTVLTIGGAGAVARIGLTTGGSILRGFVSRGSATTFGRTSTGAIGRLGATEASLNSAQSKLAGLGFQGIKAFIKRNKGKLITTGVGAVIGGDLLATWLASDNVLDGVNFTVNSISEGVRVGAISPTEAIEAFDEVEDISNTASGFIKTSVRLNPVLWIIGKPYLINVEKAKIKMDIERRILNRAIQGR